MPYDMSGVTSKDRYTNPGNIDAVFTDGSEQDVSVEDFLTLMVAQLKNQDFMNPVDDTQYMAQLAQFSSLQQMQEMAYNSKTTFLTSLMGKEVVAAKITVNGDVKKTEGVVSKVSFVDNKFMFYIGDEGFTLDQLMQVVDKTDKTEDPDKTEEPKDEGTENA